MRIAVVNTQVPFTHGGAEQHAKNLLSALQRHGHEAELVSIPFNWRDPWSALDHLMATRLLDLEEVNGKTIDQVIGLRFPAYHLRHPRKVLWIIHQYRSAYDFWDHPQADLPLQEGGKAVRDSIRFLERRLFNECANIFANSQNVSNRLRRFCGHEAPALYHPPGLADLLSPQEAEPYFLCPGRIETMKRQDFVLESLALTKQSVRIRFAGTNTDPKFQEKLDRLVAQHGLKDRVSWEGFVSDQELATLYGKAQAIVYAPIDEDYGYVSLEAALSHKPVVTTQASGGVLEFVNQDTGWVASDTPEAFAHYLDEAWAETKKCREKGGDAFSSYQTKNISWDHVVQTLTQA
ncbi:glycosyltransferase family 4 protein [Pelagicoccus enzymogenes]|uniref:glycosyltransferase family 4 protein n=1 Tax=Pelagicoccus enzymogenes TaxID=2773457 RepID=UPI00280CA863|nr:glycosyltransferase family 4 protein [Pelagicoccus enzymogenes]MDQ8197557.1 glycosyltransferase family 4 protein [Pelagicoccus enzymogenes]